jgi:hypothetical protein
MRRLPVRVQGRVVADTILRLPIAGADVIAVDDPGAPPGTHTLSLRTPLYLAHPAGTTVREIAMTSFGSTTLQADAVSGGQVVSLLNRSGLAPGSVLRIASPDDTSVEYGIVDSLGPGGGGAGLVFLRQALNRTYTSGLSGATVQFLNPGAAGMSGTLLRDTDSASGILIASAVLSASPVEIDPGTGSTEYHELGALAGIDGYYAIDGVSQIKELFLQASHAGFTSVTQVRAVEYDHPVNVVDFRLS